MKTLKINDDSIVFEYENGYIEYRNADGLLHRENGPARIFPNGHVEWYKNGSQLIFNIEGFEVPANVIVGIDSMGGIDTIEN